MFRIVYVSAAVEPMEEDARTFLLRQSRENNEVLGRTGMLLDFRDVLPEEEAQAPSDERQEAFDEREAERG